jgi:hypothetical protein
MTVTRDVSACEVLLPESTTMIPSLLLADAAADPMLAVVAVFAVLCGAVLLGGRSVIRLPYQILRSFLPREPRHESVACPREKSPDAAS